MVKTAGTICLVGLCTLCQAQFIEEFADGNPGATPPGWSHATGDGEAVISFIRQANDYATITVDARADRRNIWWAIIRRQVDGIDIEKLSRPGWELRAEARIRTSHAPRRVNLHFNHQRTTDYHSHLMEYDIPEAGEWHSISMTTQGFDARPGDRVNVQMALMDWGTGIYEIDVDYFRVDVVTAAMVEKDLGHPLPYHPPVPDPASLGTVLSASRSAIIDHQYPDMNFAGWQADNRPVLVVSGTQTVVLAWEFGELAGSIASGPAVLELTTNSLQRDTVHTKDFGMVRVTEILAGDPGWDPASVTWNSFLDGAALEHVLNEQMVIDYPVNPDAGGTTSFVINERVLQRLLDGRTRGLAIRPLGAVNAVFAKGAVLRINSSDDGSGKRAH